MRMAKSFVWKGWAAGVMLLLPLGSVAVAQEEAQSRPTYLVNIDTPDIVKQGKFHLHVDHRPFGSLENISYTNVGLEFGLSGRTEAVARFGTAVRRSFANGTSTLLQGGKELELGIRYLMNSSSRSRLAFQGGVIVPDSRPQSKLGFGGELIYSRKFGAALEGFFTPKVLVGDAFVGTLGGGLEYHFGSSLSLFGDFQRAIIGNNGTNTSTGTAIQKYVWGIGARYNPTVWRGKFSLDLGVTNGLGRSLGMSTSASLAGSAAVFFGVSIRP